MHLEIVVLWFKIIKNLRKEGIVCFTGSCPEIYLEKAFKNLKNFKLKRLENCKILGKTSLAIDMNHTLTISQHKKQFYPKRGYWKKWGHD